MLTITVIEYIQQLPLWKKGRSRPCCKAFRIALIIWKKICRVNLQPGNWRTERGFSLYHYYRLFHRYTGMPVMQYILRRRLLHAAYAIRMGEKRTAMALAYGFDTYAGFYKAFRREFGCTPGEYVRKNRAKRPGQLEMLKSEMMELTIETARKVLKYWERENETITALYYESSGHKAMQAVRVGKDCVLKREREQQTLLNSCRLAQELESAGVHSQLPLPADDGRRLIQEDGWWYCLVKQPGAAEIKTENLYGSGSASKARLVGEMIGQLHLILRKAEVSVKEADLLSAVRDWALPAVRGYLRLSEAFIGDFLQKMERLYPQLPRQIIHRDPNPGVILNGEDGWGVIDLERADRNARLFDPCYAATAVLSESFDEKNMEKPKEWLGIYHHIMQGYDSVSVLTEQEKECAPYMLLANQFVCVAWFVGQKQFPELFEINLKMTKWLIAHQEQLKLE